MSMRVERRDQSRIRASLTVTKQACLRYFPALEVRKLWADFLLGAFSLRAVTFISHTASFFCLCAQFAMPAECPTASPEGR